MTNAGDPPEYRVIDNRYELMNVLGKGGHGIVYRALDRETRAHVAIKFLHDSVAVDPQYNIRMLREAQVMAALSGTSAIRVYGLRTTLDGALYLVMELLDGEDLDDYLVRTEATGARMTVFHLFELLDPIVDTLEAAHTRGIIHRDLKPGNIFVQSAGGVRLLDFGLAKVMAASPLTSDGMIAGSPSYIAPEVWKGNPRVLDQRIDVYSMGAIVYRVLSGKVPFAGRTIIEKFQLATTGERPSLYEERPDLPPDVDAWVGQALAIDPEVRFLRVRGMWSALRSVLGVPRK
ncbi:MAG TPA: serine/threonine-protein kinase [Polyangiaceae bacterium]|nr:serine/threonine-protein kinase [Polyangiaceae bacterium]